MVRGRSHLLATLALMGCAGSAEAGEDHCADLLSAAAPLPAGGPLVPEDLLRLTDIGPVDPEPHQARLLTLSPDHRLAAFQVQRADPVRNTHCRAMVVVDLSSRQTRIVDRGGGFIEVTIDARGKTDFPTGVPVVVAPRWASDGRWLAFLKRSGGKTQVWRAAVDGSGSAQLTRSADDVEDFRIAADGKVLVLASRPALRAAYAAITEEGRTGFHYDDRYSPATSTRPLAPAPIATSYVAQVIATGRVRDATPHERALFTASNPDSSVWTSIRSSGRRRAWTQSSPGQLLWIYGPLFAEGVDGQPIACAHAICQSVSRPWWTDDGRRVRFIVREGWARASTAIYEWSPGPAAPRRLYLTDDVLVDCAPSGDDLICLREGARQPRRLERLSLTDARRTVLFDPNPGFAKLRTGTVERLKLKNSFGFESVADLVFPVGYRPGIRYPLIVVQYDTRGFLRGGTGDEYPIQAFANRGYAVLSVGQPPSVARNGAEADDPAALSRRNLAGFADRRSALSAVETGVHLLIARGIADPVRIGITGFSNGATTATYALLHSKLFAAAAMSSCCFDTTLPTRVGPYAARYFAASGYPRMIDRDDTFWKEISLSLNARRVNTPILLQVPDHEMMSALESYTALREAGQPVDMYVFPDEYHSKKQPAHRLAVYRRALDWFDYWLKDERSAAPDRQRELAHWDALRREGAKH
jgi:dipeptidyl aminopeptidase/acylaminoacyl peptidase